MSNATGQHFSGLPAINATGEGGQIRRSMFKRMIEEEGGVGGRVKAEDSTWERDKTGKVAEKSELIFDVKGTVKKGRGGTVGKSSIADSRVRGGEEGKKRILG